jgi:hypothetical protein
MGFDILISEKKKDFYKRCGRGGFKQKPIEGRFPYKNTVRVLADEKVRAEYARKTGASISRRALKEFDVPSANQWKRAQRNQQRD